MKLIIEQSDTTVETTIKISCGFIDERLERLIDQIRLYSFSIPAEKDGLLFSLPPEEIDYFDTVDNKTFIYTKSSVYECRKKLYEIEGMLSGSMFSRISKSTIVNTLSVKAVKALFNGRMELILTSGDRLILSKHYMADFKKKFK